MIDFTEIPQGNRGGLEQDRFEQFAADCLETMGFTIVGWPFRGADRGRDLIVKEKRTGVGGESTITWLVSCKHHAHSNRAVALTDELNILERVSHNCTGFIGFYSTIPASSLSNTLEGLADKIEYQTYDNARIEKEILSKPNHRDRILEMYFPLSYEKFRKKIAEEAIAAQQVSDFVMSEEAILDTCKTALIILKVDEMREEYELERDWQKRGQILNKLHKFSTHSNERLAQYILSLVLDVSYQTRYRFPEEIACSLESLVMSFFPSSYKSIRERPQLIDNGKICVYVGFNIAYDAFIKTDNFSVARWGLSIFQYIYRQAIQNNLVEVLDELNRQLNQLEETLRRPERSDLGDAQRLTSIYRNDLKRLMLDTPDMPEDLFHRIENDEKKKDI